MPRAYYTENWEAIAAKTSDSGENVYLDFCKKCWRKAAANEFEDYIPSTIPHCYRTNYADEQDAHPPYAGESYTCERCDKPLSEEDD